MRPLHFAVPASFSEVNAMSAVITAVDPHSPARRAGIRAGDTLLRIGSRPVRDVLDYKFYGYDVNPEVTCLRDGAERVFRLHKPEGADIGLTFGTYLMDAQRHCGNKCVFCFIDQLPPGMRESLYFKDDDARLSFLLGNYITLTNLSDADAARMIRMRVSPLNISVHSTDPALRARMLGNPQGGGSLKYLYDFAAAGLRLHTQIVVCPGLNDGAALEKTLADLSALAPAVESVAVVPVGLTRHRAHLPALTPVGEAEARAILAVVDRARAENLRRGRGAICCAADELYLKAHLPLPGPEYYDGYPQLENGVGLMPLFEEELRAALSCEDGTLPAPAPLALACGMAAREFMERMAALIAARCPGLSLEVLPVRNDFFGASVDVSGLVTGGDLIAQLRGRAEGKRLLLPMVMLRHGETVFLDDVSLEDVGRELRAVPVPVEIDGGQFLDAVLGRENQ